MTEQEDKVKTLEEELLFCKKKLEKVLFDQDQAAKLLIRRDLALTRANEQLQALDTAKSEFISVAAHQLRTPLSALKWILYMLRNNELTDPDQQFQFLDKAIQSNERMIELVNDLLEVDHIESGKDQFIFTKVNIKSLIGAISSELQTLVQKRGVHFTSEVDSDAVISGDVNKLRAVFQNLIENAIKYTPSGGSVGVSSVREDGFIKVLVTDSGIGIPTDQNYRIFSKFFRASNAMKVDTVGSGLGLFIAKEIVERHGGKIWFESKVGQGTVFFVELPLEHSSEVKPSNA